MFVEILKNVFLTMVDYLAHYASMCGMFARYSPLVSLIEAIALYLTGPVIL